jgi:hypothetical protein
MSQPHFANARSVRNALDRARLRHARRVFDRIATADRALLSTIRAEDILASRVFEADPPPAPSQGRGKERGERDA